MASDTDHEHGALDDEGRAIFDRALQFVIGHVSSPVEGAYVHDLLMFLTRALDVEFAVCHVIKDNDPTEVEVFAVCQRGTILDGFAYSLVGTPCLDIFGASAIVHDRDLQARYPRGQILKDVSAESYVGIPLWAADGSPLGLIAVVHTEAMSSPDLVLRVLQVVSTRAAAELERSRGIRQLTAEQQRFADFANVSSDFFWEFDKDLRFSFLSDRYEAVAGVPPSDLLGKTRKEVGAPGVPEEELENLLRTLDAHEPFRDFIHYRDHPNGERVYLSISGQPVFDGEGNFEGYRGIGKDVTKEIVQARDLQRLAEQAESQHETLLKVMNGIPALIAYIDKDRRYVMGNGAYRRWFNIDHTRLPGRSVEDVHDEARCHDLDGLLERGLEGDKVPVTLDLKRYNGYLLEVEGVIEPQWDDKGSVDGCFIFLEDVTDRRAAERAVRQAEIAARRSDRAKSQFLANMSHELRSPLNSIIGFSDLMAIEQFGPLGNEKYVEYAGGIRSASQHLLAVISDILDLSKVESGVFELEDEPVEIEKLVQAAMTLVRPLAEARHQTLEVDVSGGGPVVVDERLMRQVLVNLLSNAIKFSPDGQTITISDERPKEGGLRLSVVDRGIGISKNEIDHVFEPFGQVRHDAMIAHEGIGLGLSLSRKIVEMHGGTLSLESEEGRGTTAVIALPASRSVSRANPRSASG
ncbi:MAG: ATP-binding protein [Rhodospirillales bacterium]